jgi:uncharacterized protein (TIGR03032 family)
MRLESPFIRLAFRVDPSVLAAEMDMLPESAWRAHPEGAPGNTAVPLVATEGDPEDDSVRGPMQPTPWLDQLPYHRAVLASLGAPIGRTRLMRVASEGSLAAHVDTNRYWQEHLRVHLPVITARSVRFTCADDEVHMAAGEAWVFDTWRRHGVVNPAGFDRVHLVIDTVGSAALWRSIDSGAIAGLDGEVSGPVLAPGAVSREPVYETSRSPLVTSPWQQAAMAEALLADLETGAPNELRAALRDFVLDWNASCAQWGNDPRGRPAFERLIATFDAVLDSMPPFALPNGATAAEAIRQLLLRPALGEMPDGGGDAAPSLATRPRVNRRSEQRLDRPVFVVCPPRSGSTLMFETLARANGVYTIGAESHEVFEAIPALHPANRGWSSNVLGAEDAQPDVVRRLEEAFIARSQDRDGHRPSGLAPLRLLEKTPKNALRVPFLAAAFPDALFIYLHREPRDSVSSMLDAWRSGRFTTYPQLPGWPAPPWSLLLIPGWRTLVTRELAEVAARQWAVTTATLLDDLEGLTPERWLVASHEQLVDDPEGEARRLCERVGLEWDRPLLGPLPLSRTTLDPPAAGKWKRNAPDLESVWSIVEPVEARAAAVLASPPVGPPPQQIRRKNGQRFGNRITAAVDGDGDGDGTESAGTSPEGDGTAAFASVHTASLPELLQRAASSIVVTTYQSGRVIVLRAGEDGKLNTHLRALPRPMGVAVSGGAMAIGTDQSVWRFDNRPAVAGRLPGGVHDGCFIPRSAHVTGDISIHEMAWAGGELWIVNTRFSCLATLDPEHSFVPRWRPPFVTALAAEDRCHLNGLAVVDDRPRFVTAMGMTDDPQGWRRDKVGGGVIIDVETGAVVAQDLTMPHSPRWHDGRLWVLDSGRGTLATVDIATGRVNTVVQLPGFTRGLAFIGRYALVGLSKVREHVFAGLPLAEHVAERMCGVWVVDTVAANIVGFVRFQGSVEEIFDVQLMAGFRYPDIIEPGDPIASTSFTLPDAAMADVVSQP